MQSLRLAMLGMIPGNGHPYSWSAIVNGFEPGAPCPYPVIVSYLSQREPESVGLPGVQVTHLWTDNPQEADAVAWFARIPEVVGRPEDVIGQVDAVLIATDDGDDHVRRARPFVEAGLPVFVDKPLATNREDLQTFAGWKRAGARILSSSGMRYAPELEELRGWDWQWLTAVTCNSWKRYGIHVLEPAFVLCEGGFETVRAENYGSDLLVHLRKGSRTVTLGVLPEAKGSFGTFHAYGPERQLAMRTSDTYTAFRGQMMAFADFVRSGGTDPYPFEETLQMMTIILAAEESVRRSGALVDLLDFRNSLNL